MPIDYDGLSTALKGAKNDAELFDKIVNSPFEFKPEMALLFLGIIVLLQVNRQTGMIDRVALSQTELAKNTTDVSVVPFENIKIPVDDGQNIIAQAIRTGTPQDTIDWNFLFTPALSAEQARINQASGGIAYSVVYPLKARDGGALIFSYFQYQQGIGEPQREFMHNYSQLTDQALQT